MKRPAIAGLWVGSIAATWLLVRGATPEDVAVTSAKPATARDGAMRVARLPALPSSSVIDGPDDTAFRQVMATLERDLADGRWGVDDRDRLNRGLLTVTGPQASELYDVLVPKLNEGSVKSDIEGPPI